MMSRRVLLSELGVIELVERLLTLEYENELLRRALAGAFCGDLHDGKSCQLARGHDGDHVWAKPDVEVIVRWPRSSEDRTLGDMSTLPPAFRVWDGVPCYEDPSVPLVDDNGKFQLYLREGQRIRVHPDRREAFDQAAGSDTVLHGIAHDEPLPR